MFDNFKTILPSLPYILEGVLVTLKFTLTSIICGLPLGGLFALIKINKRPWVRRVGAIYTSIFRGTPLLVQLVLIYYALPELIQVTLTPFQAGVLTFSLNSAAYSSEIMRAGIQAIDRGQWEAAQVLGLSYRQTFFGIILPQALRDVLPSLVNELVDLLKESALVSVIGEGDLLRRAQMVAAEKYLYFEPYLIAAFGYYTMVMMMSSFARLLERKLRNV